jgi:hypothetical protein
MTAKTLTVTSATAEGTAASLVAAEFGGSMFPVTLKVSNLGRFARSFDTIEGADFEAGDIINLTFPTLSALSEMVADALEYCRLNGDTAGFKWDEIAEAPIVPYSPTSVAELGAIVGEVQETPTAYTLLDRLKTLATYLGILTETAPGTDTASSGVNGRLQRIAQRITSMMALVGEVQASPTANTLLDRLKTLATLVGEVQASPTANTVLARLKTIATNTTPGRPYETVAASQTDQVLGGAGAAGDVVDALICTVATAATSAVTLTDGAAAIPILAANTPIGVYTVELNLSAATGPWKVTTGAGVSVIASGSFSA